MAVDFDLLKDIETKPGSASSIAVLGAIGNEVAFAFTAQDTLRFRDQLWEVPSDESGPAHPLHDAGNFATIGTTNIVAINGRYLFNRSSNLPEEDGLWSTDGTPAGSVRLGPSATDTPTIAARAAYYFVHQFEGTSLWATDGTVAGTRKIAEDRDAQDFHFESPLASNGNQVYMVVKDHWSIRHIATIDSDDKISPVAAFPQGDTVQLKFVDADTVLITNNPLFGSYQNELYSYSADQGLVLIFNKVGGVPNLSSFQLSGGKAFFVGESFSLWSTDGTLAGTSRILNGSFRFSDRPTVAAIGNHFLFAAYHDDGTRYFYSDSDRVNSDLHSDKDGNVLFVTDSRQIYRVDVGSTQATYLGTLSDNGIWYDLSRSSFLTSDDGIVFVGIKLSGSFKEKNLWFSNGSETRLLRDFTNGDEDVTPMLLGKVGDRVIVASGNQRLGYSLWSTDGTAERTFRILHTPRGIGMSAAGGTVGKAPDGRLLIAFFDAQFGREIWITDGTATGTELFSDIATGANNSDPRFGFFGEKILAFASTTQYGAQEPFVADFNQFVSTQSNSSFRSIVDENHRGAFLGSIRLSDIPASDMLGFRLHDPSTANRYLIDVVKGDLRLQPTFAFDFETEQTDSVDVDVEYRDPVSRLSVTRQLTVGIQVVNEIEAPIVHDQVLEVDENLDLGEFVGKIAVNAERDSTINFSRTGGWPFNVYPKSGRTYVLDASTMDYERHHEMIFVVMVNDSQNSLSATAKITVRLRDIDEFPVLSQQFVAPPETIFSGTVSTFEFAPATFTDPEEQPVTYRVTRSDGSALLDWISFDAGTRVLSASPMQPEIGVHWFLLTAKDPGGNESSIGFRIIVLDGQFPWYNALLPMDVNRDGKISPIDALLVINRLNQSTQRSLPTQNASAAFFYDTNRDGSVTPIDALLVINQLNNRSGSGEGEQVAHAADYAFADVGDTLGDLFTSVDNTRKRRAR